MDLDEVEYNIPSPERSIFFTDDEIKCQKHLKIMNTEKMAMHDSSHLTPHPNHDDSITSKNISPKYKPGCHKGARPKKDLALFVVGREIGIEEVPEYLATTLVGRLCEKNFGETSLRSWVEHDWGLVLD